jgi:nucleoid DNA-binding protein
MNKKLHDHGFTIKKATEQIRNRKDNTYNKKTIEKFFKMYVEECTEALPNGEKVNIRGIDTFRFD